MSADKRQFLKLALGAATAYSVPLMASFPMLTIGGRKALAEICYGFEQGPSADLVGSSVQVSWIIGCQGNAPVLYEASADVTAWYGCRNRAGIFPKGLVQTVAEEVRASASIQNEVVHGTLTLTAPGPQQIRCPPGFEPVLVEILYENIALTYEDELGRTLTSASPMLLAAVFHQI